MNLLKIAIHFCKVNQTLDQSANLLKVKETLLGGNRGQDILLNCPPKPPHSYATELPELYFFYQFEIFVLFISIIGDPMFECCESLYQLHTNKFKIFS